MSERIKDTFDCMKEAKRAEIIQGVSVFDLRTPSDLQDFSGILRFGDDLRKKCSIATLQSSRSLQTHSDLRRPLGEFERIRSDLLDMYSEELDEYNAGYSEDEFKKLFPTQGGSINRRPLAVTISNFGGSVLEDPKDTHITPFISLGFQPKQEIFQVLKQETLINGKPADSFKFFKGGFLNKEDAIKVANEAHVKDDFGYKVSSLATCDTLHRTPMKEPESRRRASDAQPSPDVIALNKLRDRAIELNRNIRRKASPIEVSAIRSEIARLPSEFQEQIAKDLTIFNIYDALSMWLDPQCGLAHWHPTELIKIGERMLK